MKPRSLVASVSFASRTAQPAAPVPKSRNLRVLGAAVHDCRACPLWARATHAVFGEGPKHARVMLIGEQPGKAEDEAAKPFVGPAGRVLNQALEAAGLIRGELFLTNAVKHFKWVQKGKLHMHATPNAGEVKACRPWLEAEIEAIRPELIVCLGATATRSIFGRPLKVLENRGNVLVHGSHRILITIHPSMLLRMPREDYEPAFKLFVRDLKVVARTISAAPQVHSPEEPS